MQTKKALIGALAARTQQSTAATEKFVEALGAALRETMAGGGNVLLPGVGKFSVKEKAARAGRNPRTGDAIQIASRKLPAFSAAKALKVAVCGK